ncbi:CHASE domain-containing protein [Candidatus Saccharibacteria bacterium]|nr:CHASE domain-containing protein [Candidatus Saccharibacteria bacterium]
MLQGILNRFKHWLTMRPGGQPDQDSWFQLLPIPSLLMLSVLGLTAVAAITSQTSLNGARQQTIQQRVKDDSAEVANRLSTYAQLLYGGIGRINSAPVDANGWGSFVANYNLHNNLPAIYAFGTTRNLPREAIPAFEAAMSQEHGRPIHVYPASDRPRVNPTEYIEPRTELAMQGVGFDGYNFPARQHAIDQSTREGAVILSERLELLADPASLRPDSRAAFIMYAPVYDTPAIPATPEERQATISRHVFLAFFSQRFFDQVLKDNEYEHFQLRIYDGTVNDAHLVYTSPGSGGGTKLTHHETLFGRTFTYVYSYDETSLVSRTESYAPLVIGLGGTIISAVLFLLTLFSLRARQHRVLLEKERGIKMAQDELLSLASHQLRTPATGVKQYLGMVLQGFAGKISPQQKKMLARAYDSNERQLHVINDILYLAKIESGRIVLAKTEFDMVPMLRGVIDEQQSTAKQGDVTVKYRGLRKAPICADEHMLRMVFENLLNNAIKYTNPGGTVTITTARGKDGEYRIAFTDTGVGIDGSMHGQLFRQFSRIPNERSQQVTGTGVGLYLAKHLTVLHDGSIALDSKVGQGSTFTVQVPRNK